MKSGADRASVRCDAFALTRVLTCVDHDEGQLVDAAAGGDEPAFRQLVDRHYDACLRYATRMLGNRPDAEDAVQETFVRVYRSLGAYRDNGRFRGWLFRILVNRCRTAANARSRRRHMTLQSAEDMPRAETPRPGALMDVAAVERALQTLPETQREAFLLKCVEEWTYDEMADLTGASVSALKMRVSRARDALRSQLGEEADDPI